MKRRKPKGLRKEELIRLRVTPSQKETLIKAARVVGLDVSPWVRTVAMREAGKVLREAEPEAPEAP
jgi:uncharacterized protein (DUF1778 family)